MRNAFLPLLLRFALFLLQDDSSMAIEHSAAENGEEKHSTAQCTSNLRFHQMQYIPDSGKKRTVAMNFGNSSGKKEEKKAESGRAAKKPKKAGNHGRVSKAPRGAAAQRI